ncbi:MAG: 50S ribosomal protein L23 [Candidatus Nealsonbacteria bacterium CG23_combo_of_CG06-09_8_20_14_all_40_13]|uniref:Large ribosomal subunit protein uL23 n=1 Tax=Candidatus Nealsonbacteria bacterium CG23_combo_of_CG06-09_8_20_14_all_40_13 TaxID=1974724 RepID=A0A2G9YSJ9_9BACT|nr:MAG: 50S ribosomal protein L23 [Candidatus Nealsonbacteria bacterium CG23_combo_of_CG06-09_8_20_14_all_40_13]PIR71191.1 MAG: 50S ribosomal protein L23 [Candidatus Nealsonbacteria bacterium CG10_big_fil_rev_8_21_14_0_10_40_24]PIU43445.1 MAG: 50S ribosomal protein L23 [Candidatus Nealsonbacteria bacterium CG07_land_8_20_14_0_80_40_10]
MKLSQIILKPVITEKSLDMTGSAKYIFLIDKNTNRSETSKAIKDLYNVDAIKVNIINVIGKTKKVRGHFGKEKNFKKAIVTLKKGQKIEGFEVKEAQKEKPKQESTK